MKRKKKEDNDCKLCSISECVEMSGCLEERPAGGSTEYNSVREEQWHTLW